MKHIAAGALSLLMLAACSGGEEPTSSNTSAAETTTAAAPTPEPSGSEEVIVVDDAPVSATEASEPADPTAQEPIPDAALVEDLECKDISRAVRRSHEATWGPVDWQKAVQVPVGEGLTAGIEWVVVVASPDGTSGRARLTNAGSVDAKAADWLPASEWESSAGNGYWKFFPTVKWDAAGHKRLNAAVAKGYECLEMTYPDAKPEA